MRVPNAVHTSRPWRIHELAEDFTLEDVWSLPANGDAADFQLVVDKIGSGEPSRTLPAPARVLWWVRDKLGRWFDLGEIGTGAESKRLPIPGTSQRSLAERLPDDLRGTVDGFRFESLPFDAVYRTDDEFAAEISNRTVHGIMHLAWAPEGEGHYRGQMAVYVKPRGRFGAAYMAFIKPFRYLIVYPALMRQMEREWKERTAG